MLYKNERKAKPGDVVVGQSEDGKTLTGTVVGIHYNGKGKIAELNIVVDPADDAKIGTGATTILVKSDKFLHLDDAPKSSNTVASPAVAKTGNAPGA